MPTQKRFSRRSSGTTNNQHRLLRRELRKQRQRQRSTRQRPNPLQRLSEVWGIDLRVKRDDLTGFGLSGNKVRKLDLLLQHAIREGADTVITTGGLQSNHCRATAVACRQLGLEPVLLLRGSLPDVPDSNLLLDHLLGAQLRTCTPEEYRHERDAIMAAIAAELETAGRRPVVVPEGGSNALGSSAFAAACDELRAQVGEIPLVL